MNTVMSNMFKVIILGDTLRVCRNNICPPVKDVVAQQNAQSHKHKSIFYTQVSEMQSRASGGGLGSSVNNEKRGAAAAAAAAQPTARTCVVGWAKLSLVHDPVAVEMELVALFGVRSMFSCGSCVHVFGWCVCTCVVGEWMACECVFCYLGDVYKRIRVSVQVNDTQHNTIGSLSRRRSRWRWARWIVELKPICYLWSEQIVVFIQYWLVHFTNINSSSMQFWAGKRLLVFVKYFQVDLKLF